MARGHTNSFFLNNIMEEYNEDSEEDYVGDFQRNCQLDSRGEDSDSEEEDSNSGGDDSEEDYEGNFPRTRQLDSEGEEEDGGFEEYEENSEYAEDNDGLQALENNIKVFSEITELLNMLDLKECLDNLDMEEKAKSKVVEMKGRDVDMEAVRVEEGEASDGRKRGREEEEEEKREAKRLRDKEWGEDMCD